MQKRVIWNLCTQSNRSCLEILEDEFAMKYFHSLSDLEIYCGTRNSFQKPDLAIIDMSNPDSELLSWMVDRSQSIDGVPVLAISARLGSITLRDYFLKYHVEDIIIFPFREGNLRVKVRHIIKKSRIQDSVSFDPVTSTIKVNGRKSMPLTRKETQIMLALTSSRREVVARSEITKKVWGDIKVSRKSLDVHICNLRKKIALAGIAISSPAVNKFQLMSGTA